MSSSGGPRQPYDDGRWAPFPVQDWSTMPEPTGAYDPYAAVDPRWSPPTTIGPSEPPSGRPRPRWLPLLVVIMVTLLVAGGLAAADRGGAIAGVAGVSAAGTAARFLPSDGAVSYLRRDSRVGGSTTSSTHVQESARQSGSLVIGGLDFTLGVAVTKVVGLQHLDQMSFWRTTDTMIDNQGDSQQLIRMYRVDGAVELVAESRSGGADVYSPALVELPAQVDAGDSWSTEGTVGSRRYRSELRAAAAGPGCLLVTGTLVESTADGQPGVTREMATTWCEGRGITAEQSSRDGVVNTVESVPAPAADPTLRTVDEPAAWSDPASWRRRDFDLMSSDASLGSGIMTGAAAGQVPPVVTTSGLVFRATSGDDVVATTPKLVDRWVSLWRLRPGGTLLSLAAFGDVVVVTTSKRQVVGYSDAGVRLWAVDLDDVAFWAPVRVDDRRVAVADAAGGVRLVDLLTGAVSWSSSLDAQVSAPLVATADTVVALDAGGSTTALETDSGQQRWSVSLPGTRAAAFGGMVVVRNAATLEALDLQTGRRRWMLPQTGTLDALQPYGDVLVSATQLGTVVLDRAGTVVRELPAYERITVVGDVFVGWGPKAAEFRDRSWTVVATIDTPDVTLAHALPPTLAYRQGVMIFGAGWTFSTWSDEP